jgi:hypothetical protein
MLTLLIFTVLLILIMINLPIAVAMALTAIAFFAGLDGTALLTMLPQRMYASTTGFTLLAIPFFILAGNLMNTGGVTGRIFRFARAVIGHVSGGLGQVCVGHRRRGRPGAGAAQGHGRQRVQAPGVRRHRRRGRHDRARHSAQHPLRALRCADRRLGRQALPGRLHPRGADGGCHDGRHRAAGAAQGLSQSPTRRVGRGCARRFCR